MPVLGARLVLLALSFAHVLGLAHAQRMTPRETWNRSALVGGAPAEESRWAHLLLGVSFD
jgi:hypothetical protein